MRATREELLALLGLLGVTEPEELNCEEFLSQTPGFLEQKNSLTREGIEGYSGFLHHLKICPECQEEFDALTDAMDEGVI